jgi:hypothetical protein
VLGGTGDWGFYLTIDQHDLNLVAVSGADIRPFKAPPAGIELQPGDRFEFLLDTNKPCNSSYMIKMVRCDPPTRTTRGVELADWD